MSSKTAFAARQVAILEGPAFAALNPDADQDLNAAQYQYLLGFAVLSPSPHNTLPLGFRLDVPSKAIEVLLSRCHVLEASDPNGKEALISAGCAIESIIRAAAIYGYVLRWHPQMKLAAEPVSSGDGETVLGRVSLSGRVPAPSEAQRLAQLLLLTERKTLRSEFDRSVTLPDELRQALSEAARESPRVTVACFEAAPAKFAWGKLDELALKHKLEQRSFRLELGRFILPNDDAHTVRGMRGREFGLDDAATIELIKQLSGELPLHSDQLAFMARGTRAGLQSASAVSVLAALDEAPATSIEVGRVFQRFSWQAWACGFACTPHTAVCQVPHARAMARATLMPNRLSPSMIIRLGVPLDATAWERPHSSRPPLEMLLHQALPL
jgi:hypothetical protein